jgi:ribosome maturation factor RimP
MARLPEETWRHLVGEVTKIVEDQGMELWDMEYKPERRSMVLRVYIDRDGSVTVDDCAQVSGHISMMLDVEDLISESYTLEVSSPGLDRKLVKPEHYVRYIGRKIHIKLHPHLAGRKKFKGRLESIDGDTVVLFDEDEKQTHTLDLGDVQTARLEVEM